MILVSASSGSDLLTFHRYLSTSAKRPTMRMSLEEDPLSAAIAPPVDETPEEREAREKAELEARRISDEIDEQIKVERAALKKKKRPVKVLLLGQSESGKTATLKNFQLTYARREWAAERASWRAVIQLNLLRNVNQLLDVLAREMPSPPHAHEIPSESDTESEIHEVSITQPSSRVLDISSTADLPPPLQFTERHRLLKLRLAPLRRVQQDLERRLGAAAEEMYTSDTNSAAPFDDFSNYATPPRKRVPREFYINSSNGWKTALDKFRPRLPSGHRAETGPGTRRGKDSDVDEITECIAGCRDDMRAIWEDPVVKDVLSRRKSKIEDAPGFFLNDVERIATRDYQPTDDDVVRARLRTLGVQEYKFVFEEGRTAGHEWQLYDVGGTRSSRAAWYPYFDDVDAIIFLAPISCFDEKLAEDRNVNRLEDSFLLWRSVLSCKLLAKTQIILFLNKCDLLQAKLRRGVKVKDYVSSFGDRSNDLGTVTKYFSAHFKEILKQHSTVPRPFYVHLTSVVDTKATATTLGLVEEGILRDHLHQADLL